MAPWRPVDGGLEIRIRVTPRGGRDALDGIEMLSDGSPVLKLRVRAVPENGAANEALRRLLARSLNCSASGVSLTAGASARVKTFRAAGDPPALSAALAALTGRAP